MTQKQKYLLIGLLAGLPISFLTFSPVMKFLCSLNGVHATTWEGSGYYYSCVTKLDAWLWERDENDNRVFKPELYEFSRPGNDDYR